MTLLRRVGALGLVLTLTGEIAVYATISARNRAQWRLADLMQVSFCGHVPR